MLQGRLHQRAGTLSGGAAADGRDRPGAAEREPGAAVDEPTKGLAPALVTEVARVLERVAELATVLLVEQNLGVVRALAGDAVVLDQGRVVHDRPGEAELLDEPASRSSALPRRRRRRPREHVRPADDHRPRARRAVLPDRLRPVADLRADGRAQLRPRRVPHDRRLRELVVTASKLGGVDPLVLRFLLAAAVRARRSAPASPRSSSSS